jgi:hypothetical protein
MKRHTTLGNPENKQGVLQQAVKTVKQNIADSAAKHYANHAVKKDITDFLCGPSPPAAVPCEPIPACPEKQKSEQVHDPVPVHMDRSERECYGIDRDVEIIGSVQFSSAGLRKLWLTERANDSGQKRYNGGRSQHKSAFMQWQV